jgi:hypothetical protein
MSRVRAWTCSLITAVACASTACGGIAQESDSGGSDPFSTFEEQPSGRRGGGRRGNGGPPPPFDTPPPPFSAAPPQSAPPQSAPSQSQPPSAPPRPPAESMQPQPLEPLQPPSSGPSSIAVDAGSPSCDAGSCAPGAENGSNGDEAPESDPPDEDGVGASADAGVPAP